VTYALGDSYHSLCLDKKDIIYAELEACEKLLNYTLEDDDKKTIESEIAELNLEDEKLAPEVLDKLVVIMSDFDNSIKDIMPSKS
jgi:hypothetical protein